MPGSSRRVGQILHVGRKGRLGMGLLTAMVLFAALAVPAFAAKPQKIYNLTLDPASTQAVEGQRADFYVTVTNKSPGNSNSNSFSVILPAGFELHFNTDGTPDAAISAETNPNDGAAITARDDVSVIVPPATTPDERDVVGVQSLDPMKTNEFVTLRVNATAPTISPSCTLATHWYAEVWTGSNLSGDSFSLNNGTAGVPGQDQLTTVVACLQLHFVDGYAPSDGTTGEAQDVRVEVLAGTTRVTSFTGPIKIDLLSGPTGGGLSGNGDPTPVSAVAGVADFASFTGTASGDYTVRATTTVSDVSDSADVSFTLYDGLLACPSILNPDLTDTASGSGDGDATVVVARLENYDGSDCVAKQFILTSTTEAPPGGGDDTNVITFDQEAIAGQDAAHYTMEITWTYPPGSTANENPATIGGEVFYIDLGDGVPVEAELCPVVDPDSASFPQNMHSTTGELTNLDLPWCITGQDYAIDASGNVVLIQSWDGIGDPKIFK